MTVSHVAVLLIAVLATAQALTWTPGANKMSLQRPEGDRTFYVYVPKIYNPSSAVPVVFAFHGLGDSCDNFGPAIALDTYAEQMNFLYVYPCATTGLLGSAWNAGTCCLQPTTVDDVAFTRAMIDTLRQTFNVSKIFSTGFSNGAMFSERLACEVSDVFTAIASVSGCVELEPGNSQGLANCDSSFTATGKSVATLHIHGDLDLVVPWTGDALLGFPDQPTNFNAWATRNACTGQPAQTLNTTKYTNQVYETCKNGVKVELVRNSGGGHQWPRDSLFDTTQYVAEFFYRLF